MDVKVYAMYMRRAQQMLDRGLINQAARALHMAELVKYGLI